MHAQVKIRTPPHALASKRLRGFSEGHTLSGWWRLRRPSNASIAMKVGADQMRVRPRWTQPRAAWKGNVPAPAGGG